MPITKVLSVGAVRKHSSRNQFKHLLFNTSYKVTATQKGCPQAGFFHILNVGAEERLYLAILLQK